MYVCLLALMEPLACIVKHIFFPKSHTQRPPPINPRAFDAHERRVDNDKSNLGFLLHGIMAWEGSPSLANAVFDSPLTRACCRSAAAASSDHRKARLQATFPLKYGMYIHTSKTIVISVASREFVLPI